jgi:hypothetical protein
MLSSQTSMIFQGFHVAIDLVELLRAQDGFSAVDLIFQGGDNLFRLAQFFELLFFKVGEKRFGTELVEVLQNAVVQRLGISPGAQIVQQLDGKVSLHHVGDPMLTQESLQSRQTQIWL